MIKTFVIVFLPALSSGHVRAQGINNLSTEQKSQVIGEVQERLHILGFDVGPTGGLYGDKTEAAGKVYQAVNALDTTGELNAKTLARLGIGKVSLYTKQDTTEDMSVDTPIRVDTVIDPDVNTLDIGTDIDTQSSTNIDTSVDY